jgi:streptomycin 6-kinase
MKTIIPASFAQRTIAMHGPKGRAWLDRLPAILAECAGRWSLTLGDPFPNPSYHFAVQAVRTDGVPIVVKACAPTSEFAQEVEALRLFAGRGIAQLLAWDAGDEVLLLERLVPGDPLTTVDDDETATAIAADVMRQLWCPAPAEHAFPTVARWRAGLTRLRQHYGGGTGPFPAALVAEAEALYAGLSASTAEPMLLHGDLHHGNILAAQRQPWLAIDPKGLVGEPAYETGAWLRNPLPQLLESLHPGRILARRIDQLAEALDLDRARIRGWGIYQAVLSAWWNVEDGEQPGEGALACARLLSAVKR